MHADRFLPLMAKHARRAALAHRLWRLIPKATPHKRTKLWQLVHALHVRGIKAWQRETEKTKALAGTAANDNGGV